MLPPPLLSIYIELEPLWTAPDPRTLFETALTRRAWNLERGEPDAPHHESMEWLGDRVLGAVVAQLLWARFPHALPGCLDLARDQLTSAGPLSAIAQELQLTQAIRMGVGERAQGQVESDKARSDHLESLVAAAFLAGGWPGASAFVERILGGLLPAVLPSAEARLSETSGAQAMTALNARVQQIWRQSIPRDGWVVERLGGPDNDPTHQATVTLPDKSSHVGAVVRGPKAVAKASAALVALEHLDEQGVIGTT